MDSKLFSRSKLFGPLAAAALLVACGAPAAAPTAAPTAAPAKPAETKPTEAPKPAAKEPVPLEMYYPVAVGGPIAKILEGYFDDFNKKNPDVKATPVFAGGYSDVLTKIQTTLQGGGKPPALAVLLSTDLQTLLDSDVLEPLGSCVAKLGGDAYIKDFYPAFMLNSVDEKGTVWGIPFQRSTPVMYYNKNMFKEAGLDPNSPPKNWGELVAAAKKLTKAGGERWGLQIPSDGFPYWIFQSWPIAMGKNVIGADSNKVFFNTPESVESLQFFTDLIQKEKVHPEGIIPWATTPDAFLAGKAGMIFHTTGSLTNILSKANFDVGVANIPGKASFGVPTGGGNLYIFKGAPQDQKDAACRLIGHLTQPDLAAQWSKDTGYVASRKSAYDTDTMKKLIAEKPQYALARDQLQFAQKELTSHQGAQIQKIYANAIQAAIEGKKTPKQALDDAQAEADKILSQFK